MSLLFFNGITSKGLFTQNTHMFSLCLDVFCHLEVLGYAPLLFLLLRQYKELN